MGGYEHGRVARYIVPLQPTATRCLRRDLGDGGDEGLRIGVLRRLEDGIGGAASEGRDVGMPFSPSGNRPLARPFVAKILANHVNLCRVRSSGSGTRRAPPMLQSLAEGKARTSSASLQGF